MSGNNVQVDPIYLDTTDGAIQTGRIVNVIKSVEWVNPSAVGNRATLYDADRSFICDFTCSIEHRGERKYFGDKGHPFTGPFNLEKLDSGFLLVERV